MADLTDYGANRAASLLLGSGTFYVALHTGDPGSTGAANEVTETGYARQASALTVTGDTAATDAKLEFGPNTGASVTVTHGSIWDAASGGNCIAAGALDSSRVWPGGTLTFPIGDVTAKMA